MDRIKIGTQQPTSERLEEILPKVFVKLPRGVTEGAPRPRGQAAAELFYGFKTTLELAYDQLTEVGTELERIKIATSRKGRVFDEEAVEAKVGPPPPNFPSWAEAAVFAESILNTYGLTMTRWQDVQKVKTHY